MKLVVRKLVQYAKYGRCGKGTPIPPEVSWFSVRGGSDRDYRVTPKSLLTLES